MIPVTGSPMRSHRLSLPRAWLITSMLSIAIAVGGYALGKAVDCKPGQIDGQCGLGTFLGLLYGVGAGLVLFLITTVYFWSWLTGGGKPQATRHRPN
jgi:hypothetical protein